MLWLKKSICNVKLRYLAVACCGFSFDFIIYLILLKYSAPVYLANLVAFLFGSIANVILIRRFVFTDNRYSLAQDVLMTFAANGLIISIGTMVLWVLVDLFYANPYASKLSVGFATFLVNYLTRAFFFRRR